MKKPIIGITLDAVESGSADSYSRRDFYALRADYANAILEYGGIPIMIPYALKEINRIVSLIDALIIPGCDKDINPKFYGEVVDSDKIKLSPDDSKTIFEMRLLEKVLQLDKPFLGICHGMQLLNVLLGGTLIKHIEEPSTESLETSAGAVIYHKSKLDKTQPSHLVNITENSLLFNLSKSKEAHVNSNHHQAIQKHADSLSIAAKAPDGIIEAVEMKDKAFVIGVQWHCEYLNDNGLDSKLFERMIECCKF
jgi:putative glutamine amidotransferase